MDDTKYAYCRFCARLKPQTDLMHIDMNNATTCNEIFNKLIRLNCILDFLQRDLPNTVCSFCINALESAYCFVIAVEAAQKQLKYLIASERNDNIDQKPFVVDQPSVILNTVVLKSEIDASDSDHVSELIVLDRGDKYSESSHDKDGTEVQLSNIDTNIQDIQTNDLKQFPETVLTWSDYKWRCAICETQFSNISELKSHSMQYHEACNAYRCIDCDSRYLRLDNFILHICKHRKYLQLTCYKCQVVLVTVQEMKTHRSDHLTTKYKCDGCNTCFATSDKLIEHMKIYYKNARSKYLRKEPKYPLDLVCMICKKKYNNKESYRKHISGHRILKCNYICDICGMSFRNKSALNCHLLVHVDKKLFHCDLCKAGFKTKNNLISHIAVHNGAKKFTCEQCGKCFRLKKQLLSHSLVHIDFKPHTCSYCEKRFRYTSTLKIHTLQHTGEKPYSCESCLKHFTDWSNYNKHMKRIHNKDMSKKKCLPISSDCKKFAKVEMSNE